MKSNSGERKKLCLVYHVAKAEDIWIQLGRIVSELAATGFECVTEPAIMNIFEVQTGIHFLFSI